MMDKSIIFVSFHISAIKKVKTHAVLFWNIIFYVFHSMKSKYPKLLYWMLRILGICSICSLVSDLSLSFFVRTQKHTVTDLPQKQQNIPEFKYTQYLKATSLTTNSNQALSDPKKPRRNKIMRVSSLGWY